MKNRLLVLATVALAAIGMISCGNPTSVVSDEEFKLSQDNVDSCIVTLGQYEGLTVEAEKEEVTDDMIAYYSDYFFGMEAENSGIEWVAGEGSTLDIDYVGKMNGIAFDGGTASGQTLVLGSGSYIDGFEDGLIGCKAGDVVELNLTFPDPYENNPDYAGKDCVFTVTVNSVTPAYTDENVAALGYDSYQTTGDYTYFVEQILASYAESDYSDAIVQGALDQIIAGTEFTEIPEALIATEEEYINNQFESTASNYGVDVAYYLELCGTSLEELATEYAKQEIIFMKLSKELGYAATDDEISEYAQDYVDYYGTYDSAEAYIAEVGRDEIAATINANNVYDYLITVTNVTEPVTE